MPGQADILEMENALLRQELNDAQAIESQLKGRLVQIDTAAMVHINAGMRTTVACLRQRGVRFVLALFNCPDTFLYHGRSVHMPSIKYRGPLLLQAPLQPPKSSIRKLAANLLQLELSQ